MGAESEAHLQGLAAAAAACTGGFQTRRGLAARWRRRLEAALLFSTADAVLCALGHSTEGAKTAARWCAQRMESDHPALADTGAADEAPPDQTHLAETRAPDFQVCTDEPEGAFALMVDTASHEAEAFALEDCLAECLSADEDAGLELLRGVTP